MKTKVSTTKVKRTRRKRQKWQVGDYFLVPLLNGENGEFALGQAVVELDRYYVVICVLFNIKVKNEEDAIEKVKKLTEENVISVVVTTKYDLDFSCWKVVCNDKPWSVERYIDLKKVKNIVGVTIHGTGIIDNFFDAFYSLAPWDRYFDPNSFDKLLVSKDKKPKDVFYKKDIPALYKETPANLQFIETHFGMFKNFIQKNYLTVKEVACDETHFGNTYMVLVSYKVVLKFIKSKGEINVSIKNRFAAESEWHSIEMLLGFLGYLDVMAKFNKNFNYLTYLNQVIMGLEEKFEKIVNLLSSDDMKALKSFEKKNNNRRD